MLIIVKGRKKQRRNARVFMQLSLTDEITVQTVNRRTNKAKVGVVC